MIEDMYKKEKEKNDDDLDLFGELQIPKYLIDSLSKTPKTTKKTVSNVISQL